MSRRDDTLANRGEVESLERSSVSEGQASFLRTNSFTTAGSALPREAFITCPTRNPITLVFPAL